MVQQLSDAPIGKQLRCLHLESTECTGSHPIPSMLWAAEHGHAANWRGDLSQLGIISLHLAELVVTENKDKPSHWLCAYFSESLP